MTGIYKFTNKVNGKVYIGQSTQIEARYKQHLHNHLNSNTKDYQTKFYRALRKYGFENFEYEILEQSSNFTAEELNKKEKYWIAYYDSYKNGYNSNTGGENVTEKGEDHPMAKLTNMQVEDIKKLLKNDLSLTQYDIAEQYNVTQSLISEINNGDRWGFIGDYEYPIRNQGKMRAGSKNPKAALTDDQVMEIRKQSVEKTASQLGREYSWLCSKSTIDKLVRGDTYTYLPHYDRKKKEWVNPKN